MNGVEAAYATSTNGATFSDNSAQTFYIGARGLDNLRDWDKYLTEIAVWNRILNPAEVRDIYNNGLGVPSSTTSTDVTFNDTF